MQNATKSCGKFNFWWYDDMYTREFASADTLKPPLAYVGWVWSDVMF